LKREKHQKIEQGHLWAFAGDITEDISGIEPGSQVVLCESRGRILGRGYVNPHSLISVRLMTVGDEPWDESLIARRISAALEFRQRVCLGWEAYRLIFAESDGLPGLVADRYGEHIILQSATAGMEKMIDQVVQVLVELIKPESIYLRGDVQYRKLEKLTLGNKQLYGETPDHIEFSEQGASLAARPISGQKTGFFLDQRTNRDMVMGRVKGKRILDLYCYTGAWGIRSLLAGAREAMFVDSSENAIAWAMEDANRNGVSKQAIFTQADAEEFLKEMIETGEKFDVVILDPPALIKSRSSSISGLQAYRKLNRQAMEVLNQRGVLVSCSCSHLLDRRKHLDLIGEAAYLLGRNVKLIITGGQSPDHHIRPGQPETEYLKCFVCEVE
jgi:23S rRNA (cytosine1962-C5)-methyltransferase